LFELHPGREAQHAPEHLQIKEYAPLLDESETQWLYSATDALIEALGPVGEEYKTPSKYSNRLDLSYVDPLRLGSTGPGDLKANKARARETAPELELKAILIRYIREVAPVLEYCDRSKQSLLASDYLDNALSELFDQATSEWLTKHGWDVTDLMNWTWILTAGSAERSAVRLSGITKEAIANYKGHRLVPTGVYAFLLRRQYNTARGLQHLLRYAWRLMVHAFWAMKGFSRKHVSYEVSLSNANSKWNRIVHPKDDSSGMIEVSFLVIIIRLLRQARKVWPAAMDNIACLFCQFENGYNFRLQKEVHRPSFYARDKVPEEARLTFVYNTILKLLSEPSSIRPFVSASYQQQAQFRVLRRMNDFENPLIVDRRGYRAVIKIQLMRKKTLREREWASLKARSWPPWKEDKLGIHADIGPEYGISLAGNALNRAKEAGYASDIWDDAASVLSGWDLDGSPTIQTRKAVSLVDFEASDGDSPVWAARIRATRTVEEAWAVFLGYQDSHSTPARVVYFAMAERLCHAESKTNIPMQESGDRKPSTDQAMPGDYLEVLPSPTSPREAVYVRTHPPTLDEFVQDMVSLDFKPAIWLLQALLNNATSVAKGVKYLKCSAIRPAFALVQQEGLHDGDFETDNRLFAVPDSIFSSFIVMLCRCAPTAFDPDSDIHSHREELRSLRSPRWLQKFPLLYAIRLMQCRPTRYRPPWIAILEAISRLGAIVSPGHGASKHGILYRSKQDILSWHMILEVMARMDEGNVHMDLDCFMAICVCLDKAIFAAELMIKRMGHIDKITPAFKPTAEKILYEGLAVVQERFKNIVHANSMQQEIPKALIESSTEEKLEIEKLEIEREVEAANDDTAEDVTEDSSTDKDLLSPNTLSPEDRKNYLPPGCLLPGLLETPKPAVLHAFIRVLGLRRDYSGLWDLIEFMALHADEINPSVSQYANGHRMMRRCLTGTRVFLERSWTYYNDPTRQRDDWIDKDVQPAPREIWDAIREIVEANRAWGGWPTDLEVEEYVLHGRFV